MDIKERCKTNYLSGNYQIENFGDDRNSDYNDCDIYTSPLIDFSLKIKDTLKYFDVWVRLDDKYYDNYIKDTVYKFSRHRGYGTDLNGFKTIILANKNIGIIGIYDTSSVFRRHSSTPIGYINRSDSVKCGLSMLVAPPIKLEIIKRFEKEN